LGVERKTIDEQEDDSNGKEDDRPEDEPEVRAIIFNKIALSIGFKAHIGG